MQYMFIYLKLQKMLSKNLLHFSEKGNLTKLALIYISN